MNLRMIADIEERVRKTICPTYSEGRSTIEGRISQADFDTLLSSLRLVDLFDAVGDFHRKFGLPFHGQTENIVSDDEGRRTLPTIRRIAPHFLDPEANEFREKFMQEELDEYKCAVAEGNLAKAADALCDLTYVALGTAHMMHIPFYRCWFEVQRANMQKERASSADDARSTRKNSLDVVKPEGWTPPDIEGALKEYDR